MTLSPFNPGNGDVLTTIPPQILKGSTAATIGGVLMKELFYIILVSIKVL